MPTTRCKGKVWKKEDHHKWNPETQLNDGEYYGSSIQIGPPTYDPNPESENGSFFAATPALTINLGVVNPAGAALFKEGDEIYIDFTPVTKETQAE